MDEITDSASNNDASSSSSSSNNNNNDNNNISSINKNSSSDTDDCVNLFDALAKQAESIDCVNKIFTQYSDEQTKSINFEKFTQMAKDLFYDHKSNESFHIPSQWLVDIFKKFDHDTDDMINEEEFHFMYTEWIRALIYPKTALIIVDVQNDFISGSLALFRCPAGHRGEEVVPVINSMIDNIAFDLIVYSYDWHPSDHISFHENYHKRKIIERNGQMIHNDGDDVSLDDIQPLETVTFQGPPVTVQRLWPKHCVQNTWGAQLHADLLIHQKNSINIYKGINPEIDSYSAFWDNGKLSQTSLADELISRNITDVFTCGIAYDFCVAATTDHANEYGFKTTLVNDATRGVDALSIAERKNYLINRSIVITDSDNVSLMSRGLLRRPEHGHHWAMTH